MATSTTQDEVPSGNDDSILEPLVFDMDAQKPSSAAAEQTKGCILCEQQFEITNNTEDFYRHLLTIHKLVIADCKHIPDLGKYMDYWRERFKGHPITEFCVAIQTNSKDTDTEPSEVYYMLCDALPEDKDLRMKLQQQRLQAVLSQQQREREDTSFSMGCLFCKETFEGNCMDIFHHLNEEHNFNVGHPDNLVYKEEFLELLQYKLNSCVCLYCEKTFKDRHVLKEHMRKKLHKKINPKNSAYDRFYIINYLEIGKNWEDIQSEDDRDLRGSEDPDLWADWQEDELDSSQTNAVCLFCEETATPQEILSHLIGTHQFDLAALKVSLSLNFYQQVKLINYIRRQVHLNTCSFCLEKFPSQNCLREHFTISGHMTQVPDIKVWDQPEYFFPTYENDNLLCTLDDDEDDDESGTGSAAEMTEVIAEDLPVQEALERRDELIHDLMN